MLIHSRVAALVRRLLDLRSPSARNAWGWRWMRQRQRILIVFFFSPLRLASFSSFAVRCVWGSGSYSPLVHSILNLSKCHSWSAAVPLTLPRNSNHLLSIQIVNFSNALLAPKHVISVDCFICVSNTKMSINATRTHTNTMYTLCMRSDELWDERKSQPSVLSTLFVCVCVCTEHVPFHDTAATAAAAAPKCHKIKAMALI